MRWIHNAIGVLLLSACTAEPEKSTKSEAKPRYVGSTACAGCHQPQHQAWQGSHHQRAMMAPSDVSVVADFDDTAFEQTTFRQAQDHWIVRTEGADGELADFDVRYTFGVEPLQQYLLELPGNRLQALSIAWDTGRQQWFHLYPDERIGHDDVLHWTSSSQNWNYMCADCHSTDVVKRYDAEERNYATEFAEISVGCEACHGPGSLHVASAEGGSTSVGIVSLETQAEQINSCAKCHSRRSQLKEGFTANDAYLDYHLPSLLDEGLYYPDGQILDEVYVYGSFLQSKMHSEGVACSNCHDSHSAKRVIDGDGLCTQCHNETGRSDFPTLQLANYESEDHHLHSDGNVGCVSCHMPERTYMVVDPRRDHGFRIPRPDLTEVIGVPNACNACHDDETPQWAAELIAERFGATRPDNYGSVFAAARNGEPSVEAALAAVGVDAQQPAIVRATAMSLMVAYELGATGFAIEAGLHDPSPLVRIGALRGAQRWDAERRWRESSRLLKDPYLAVRVEATRALMDVFMTLSVGDQTTLRAGIDEYLETQTLNADRAEAQTNIASAFMAMAEPQNAEAALRTALELNPQWVPALVNLADLYRATDRDDEGGELLARAVSLAPDTADVMLAQALWMVRQDREFEAMTLFERASQLAPDNSRYAYVYAVALHSGGQSERALEVIDQALLARPKDQLLLRTGFSIARELQVSEKMNAYLQHLESI